jgi:hypothetical protein
MLSARGDFLTIINASKKYGRKEDNSNETDDENAGKDREEVVPADKYRYNGLSSKSSIRLLALQPGHRHDTIICQLKETTLDSSVNQYDALSYVWGAPGGELRSIQVNDGRLDIGSSLHCALQYLRYPDRQRVLWVDAICIDQSNTPERNTQVPIMREVYQNAASTVCFLGPTLKRTRALYAMLEELAQESLALEAENPTSDTVDDTLPAIINHLPVRPVETKLFDKYVGDSTIVDIAKCEWWHRAWTVQELMLSSNAIMMTGRYAITWQKFLAAVDRGLNTQIWGPIFLGFAMNPVVVPYISMRALESRYRHARPLESPARDLFTLLVNCRHRESTDPRDKIYAVLGLLRARYPEALRSESSDALDVEMDYSHDVDYVYRRICQELIRKMENLDVLGICPKTTRPLPSWATDWSITDRIGSPLMLDSLDRARTTHAAKHTKANTRFSDDGTRMIIGGYELTSVVALVELLPVPILNNTSDAEIPIDFTSMIPDFAAINSEKKYKVFKAIKIWVALIKFIFKVLFISFKLEWDLWAHDSRQLMSVFHTLFAWERFAREQPPTNPGGESDAVYWRTLCGGTYKGGSIEGTGALFNTWSDQLQPLRKFVLNHPYISEKYPFFGIVIYMRANWQGYSAFWPYIASSQRRRLGRAANGWLCLLPSETNVGDVLILAEGGRVPLIIRRGEGGITTFIGEAYVQGIMDGEAFDKGKCGEIEIH